VRYTYNAAHVRVNNWGAWGRLATAVIADYVGDAAPLYVQRMVKDERKAYDVDPAMPCDAGGVATCKALGGGAVYADALRLHLDMVDGRMFEFSSSSCDANGTKSMIRPDGGLPDELRRQYDCDTTRIEDDYGAAARYSQFASEAMICLPELAGRRGNPDLYTHIDAASGRGALYRAIQFLIDNDVRFEHGSMLEMANRFFTYQVGVERDPERLKELRALLGHDLPAILKRQHDWPEDAGWVSFGTLTHGFNTGETLRPPPTVAPRSVAG
jgi:Alginate lyase